MKWTGLNEIREKYLTFFESKGHLRHKSFPLVPINDKSILLINAGMTPLKKYFTGEVEPPRHRMTTCQKCIRTPDIDSVGITARHGTYFEMLGNFSFGDYFKNEAIEWAWEFMTGEQWLALPKERLWVTVYIEDDEAYEIWNKKIGIPEERIVRLGKSDNFWEHGSGPCGPCSEIYFDRGEEYGCGSPDCKPGCDCDRFMEFWNLVFTQFDNDGNNNYTRLAKPNIDTGMGLERLACLMQGVNNIFEVDTVRNIMKAVIDRSGIKYGQNSKADISLRVITDHIRSTTFLVCDGVVPSNEGRGYVLRRLLRRAARHGRMLGIKGLFLSDIAAVVAKENYSEYPELTEKLSYIQKVISMEEERFAATIDSGLSILSRLTDTARAKGKTVISGADAFRLYDTFGFPIDLTKEIAGEQGFTVDEEEFKILMKEQKERARSARANISGWSDAAKSLITDFEKTEFVGYTENKCTSRILGILADEMELDTISEGDFTLILDKTVFYGEGGGQVGDSGVIITENGASVTVTDTKKSDGVYLHICTLNNGTISVNDKAEAKIDICRRNAIRRNHTACHMLQSALRTVLGPHVEQAGSYVDENRLRFDFTHFAALTSDELSKVEDIVNEHILNGETVQTVETDVETAKKSGAMALFGEKYGAVVRMVKVGEFSTELCGGTHLDNSAKAGLFKIISESSVAAGIRRIEATTGLGVLGILKERDEMLYDAAKELRANNPSDIIKKAESVMAELKNANKEIEQLNARLASSMYSGIKDGAKNIGAIRLYRGKLSGTAVDTARTLTDEIKASEDNAVTVIAVINDGKLNFVASCGKDAVKRGAHAGNLLKQVSAICGGGGGGRPDSAQSGGRFIEKVDEALEKAEDILSEMIK